MTRLVEYGIDLGTTNSCIARWEDGSIVVFQNNDQMNVTPSAVHIVKTGRIIVGRRAYSALLTDSENVAIEFKRWMGQKDQKSFPATNRTLSAEELSSEVIRSLREDVRRQRGDDVLSAVITVPAAFGALQCEATARAAHLAGLEEAPLLQEPIAAAIGYGASTDRLDQRWLVFDLGGGTLDIAIVSTRDGRLNVLEHRGNNLLGGKDMDRLLVEKILLPVICDSYDLRADGPSSARARLMPRLRLKAEEAKIDLSRDSNVIVSLFDMGDDDSGVPIELDVPIERQRFESLIEPIAEKCCMLANEAISGARLSNSDIDKILLVGGPTQTPYIRNILKESLGINVDTSADPMTIVGRGAAIYASTLEISKPATVNKQPEKSKNVVHIVIAHDAVVSESQAIVAGRITNDYEGFEIKIDSDGGLWTSGWMKLSAGVFEIQVPLKESDISTFWIYARDSQGRVIETDTPEFKIRHGLVPSAPPLPHTLSIELIDDSGNAVLDPVFTKGTQLPAETTVKYRATHDLVPNQATTDLVIKLWEGEFLQEPGANEWIGNVVLSHDGIRRSVPLGSEIEVSIQVDMSRLVSVDAFVPHLNQHFTGQLYAPQRDQQDYSILARSAIGEAETIEEELYELAQQSEGTDVEDEIIKLRKELDEIKSNLPSKDEGDLQSNIDPDDARRVVEKIRNVRGKISNIERQSADKHAPVSSSKFVEIVTLVEQVVSQFGADLDKQQFSMLRSELERAASKGDVKSVERTCAELDALRWRVLFRHDWFWREIFDSLSAPDVPFVNPEAAKYQIELGKTSIERGDGDALRDVVRELWRLQPKESAEVLQERAMRSGLRKF